MAIESFVRWLVNTSDPNPWKNQVEGTTSNALKLRAVCNSDAGHRLQSGKLNLEINHTLSMRFIAEVYRCGGSAQQRFVTEDKFDIVPCKVCKSHFSNHGNITTPLSGLDECSCRARTIGLIGPNSTTRSFLDSSRLLSNDYLWKSQLLFKSSAFYVVCISVNMSPSC